MLPEWILVGFSGHRKLAEPEKVAKGLREAFDRLAANHGPFATISSAASGADTLFVEEAARRLWPYLLILPFPKSRFEKDFTPSDWQRILPLIEKATRVEEATTEASDEAAYMETGVQTVDRADVLLAVWDGKPAAGFGGTANVVSYARELGKPLILIDPDTGIISEERLTNYRRNLLPWTEPRARAKPWTDIFEIWTKRPDRQRQNRDSWCSGLSCFNSRLRPLA